MIKYGGIGKKAFDQQCSSTKMLLSKDDKYINCHLSKSGLSHDYLEFLQNSVENVNDMYRIIYADDGYDLRSKSINRRTYANHAMGPFSHSLSSEKRNMAIMAFNKKKSLFQRIWEFFK